MVGVESVTIDLDKGLVTVSGDIDPVVLLQKIKTMGKKAKLWFFQQQPDNDNKFIACSKGALKVECGGGTESDSNNEDGKQYDWHSQHKCETETMGTKERDSESRSSLVMSSNVHAYTYPRSLPRLGYQPMWSYQQSVPVHRLTPHGHDHYLQPHPPPAYRYFRPRSPQQANSMVHYTDYADNYGL